MLKRIIVQNQMPGVVTLVTIDPAAAAEMLRIRDVVRPVFEQVPDAMHLVVDNGAALPYEFDGSLETLLGRDRYLEYGVERWAEITEEEYERLSRKPIGLYVTVAQYSEEAVRWRILVFDEGTSVRTGWLPWRVLKEIRDDR